MRLLRIQSDLHAWSAYYITVPDEVTDVQVVRRLAEALSPDNRPYEPPFYTDTRERFEQAVRACGWDMAEVEELSLSDMMRDAPKQPSCGGWHVSPDSKAAMLRLAEFLESAECLEELTRRL